MYEGEEGPEGEFRKDRGGRILYAVHSRRAGGLSLGVNLFPEGKRCSFDCAYCEVFPGRGGPPFSPASFSSELEAWAETARSFGSSGSAGSGGSVDDSHRPIDIAFAGDGEPTLSPYLLESISIAAAARRRWPDVYGDSRLVLITNSTGFIAHETAAKLGALVDEEGLDIWAKLDAGSEAWYRRVDRAGPDFELLFDAILSFSRRWPIVVQSMFCAIADSPGTHLHPPPHFELAAWQDRIAVLLERGALLRELHLYTQSRPSPHRLTAPIDDAELRDIARLTVAELTSRLAPHPGAKTPPVRVFGRSGELPLSGGPS